MTVGEKTAAVACALRRGLVLALGRPGSGLPAASGQNFTNKRAYQNAPLKPNGPPVLG